jgi:hypothetical protein
MFLGLCMGVSAVSLLEFFYYFVIYNWSQFYKTFFLVNELNLMRHDIQNNDIQHNDPQLLNI